MKSILLILALSLFAFAKGDSIRAKRDIEIGIPNEEFKNCFPYVNTYGFYQPKQECENHCCGGCMKRYCCKYADEILYNQEQCQNNDFSESGNYPQKNPVCYSFVDRYDNIITEVKCDQDEFCSGTCSKRYCGNSEQHWLDQDKCHNTISSNTTDSSTSPSSITDYPTTTDSGIEPLFTINYYAIVIMLVILILFIMVITLLFKLNRMDQLLRRYRQQEQLTLRIRFDDDVPPPYTGVKY